MLQKIFYLLLLLLLWFLQIYDLSEVGLQEYDSVKNYFIVKNMAAGDFTDMFQRGSPTLFLFFVAIYKVFPSHLSLEYANAALNVAAIAIFTHIFSYFFDYKFWQRCLLLLYMGSSLYLVYCTRSFAMESMTLFVFALMFREYLQILLLQKKSETYFWILTAIMLTINYKILLLFPLLFACELYRLLPISSFFANKNLQYRKLLHLIILIIPIIAYEVLGILLGVSWKSYPAHWVYSLVMRKDLNPWRAIGTLHFDISYYFKYLQIFESPILIMGLIFFIVICCYTLLTKYFTNKKTYLTSLKELLSMSNFTNKKKFIFIILVIVVFTILEMSILPKAPRGILLIFPMLYFFSFEMLRIIFTFLANFKDNKNDNLSKIIEQQTNKKLPNFGFIIIIVLLLSYNYWQITKHIYSYTTTNYPKITNYLAQHKINKIAVTVGINYKFFLFKNAQNNSQSIDFQTINFEKDLIVLQNQDYEYCLIDDYHKIVGANVFDSLEQLPAVLSLKEPTLCSPLLYLEHCEFTGFTFEEAIDVRKNVMKDSTQLKLIKFSFSYPQ